MRSLSRLAVLLLPLALAAGCPVDPAETSGEVTRVEGRVPRQPGQPKLAVGARCGVAITGASKFGGFNCRIHVLCDGVQLYGGKRLGGYVPCEKDDDNLARAGQDPYVSAKDGDPAVDFIRERGTLAVWDQGWRVEIAFAPGLEDRRPEPDEHPLVTRR